jgi:hypothetical protein
MKNRKHYIASIVVVMIFVASTAFALIDNAPTQVSNVDPASDNTASISMLDGTVQLDGKTGWEMIVELASNIR